MPENDNLAELMQSAKDTLATIREKAEARLVALEEERRQIKQLLGRRRAKKNGPIQKRTKKAKTTEEVTA